MNKEKSCTFVLSFELLKKVNEKVKVRRKELAKKDFLSSKFYTFSSFVRECVDNSLKQRYPKIKKVHPQRPHCRKGARFDFDKWEELQRRVAMMNISRKMDNQLDYADFIRWSLEEGLK